MTSENDLQQKRAIVGVLAITLVLAGGLLLATGRSDGFASALLRVGILMGAFWLVLPTKTRPAAWVSVSPWSIGLIVIVALLARHKAFFPVLAAGILIGWFVRPRKRNGA